MSQLVTTTNKAREKFANSHFDASIVPEIAEVGWGDGGVDSHNNPVEPTPDLVTVPGEFFRNAIKNNDYPYNGDTLRVWFLTRLEAAEDDVIGKDLSSCGLYDSAGDLIAVRNFSIKGMDEDTIIEIEWIEEF